MLDRFPYYWTYYRSGAQDMHGVRCTLSSWNSARGFGNGYQFIMRAWPIDSQCVHIRYDTRAFSFWKLTLIDLKLLLILNPLPDCATIFLNIPLCTVFIFLDT